METSKLISKIKISHLPCYLSDNESAPTPLYADSITFHEFKQLNYQNFKLESSDASTQDVSPSLQYADCPSMAKLPEAASSTMLDKRTLVSKLGRTIRKYLQGDMLSQTKTKRRVKCVSMERITPEDLSLFYRYKASAKQVKKMCDINLCLLLEKAKESFRTSKKDSIQTLLEDLSRLIVNFVSSSDSALHFNKCKYILDRLEELENIIHDRFNIKYLSKDSIALTILQIPSLKTVNSAPSAEDSFLTSKNTIDSGTKTPSAKSIATNTALTPTISTLKSSDTSDQGDYKQVLNLIAQAKYTMAQMGHLLHYDRLANPDIEQFYPKNFKKKWECATIPSPPACRGRGKRTGSQTFASFSTALDVNLASIDLDTEKPQPSYNEINTTEDLSHCSNLMRFFYCNQAFLEDFEENVVKRRKESLGKYCLWKIKKWAFKYRKEKVVQKYQESEITCKICAQKVKIDKLKEHSDMCRNMAELNRELKDMEMKLGEAISDTFMRSKELRTQLLVMKNEYQRLKKKNCSKSMQATMVQNSLHIRHIQKLSSAASGGSIEDNNNLNAITHHGSNTTREEEHEWEDGMELAERKRSRKLTLTEGTRLKINLNTDCQDSLDCLDTSFGQKYENNDEYISPGLRNDNKKSFVEKVLEKYPQKYEGSPAADRYDSPTGSNKSLKRMQSLTEKKKFAELIVKSKSSVCQFYSDQKSESGSEGDLDSERQITDEDKKEHYSSEGSDALRLSVEMSSSEKSQCNSPDVSKTGKVNTVYKKSKFFLGNGLNFDKEEEEHKELEEEKKAEFEAEDEEDEEKRFLKFLEQKRGAKKRRTTLFFQRNEGMGEVIFGQLDKKMLEELATLKARIEKRRYANQVYEVIKRKGKIMLNQEPYKKEMEKIKEDTVREINNIKAKIKCEDIIKFVDNFILALEKRVQVGKKVQEAQKSLDFLGGKIVEEPVDQKKFSLIRGHSSLTLTKKRLGFASTPVALPNLSNNEEPFSMFKSINLNSLKSRSVHNTKKTFNEFNENALNRTSKDQPSQSPFDLNLNEKMRHQQESLPELQEEAEDVASVTRGDTSPFGVTNFDQSFHGEKECKRTTERKISGPAAFSLDELIANSPREHAMKSENIDSKITQISIMTDDSSPMTGTQNTIKDTIGSQKEVGSKNLAITCGNEEIEEEEERKSPDTPSFDAPLIWRTSTAPARTLSGLKLQINSKVAKNDIMSFAKNLRRGHSNEADVECNSFSNAVSIASSFSCENKLTCKVKLMADEKITVFKEEEHESEDKTPPSNLKSRRLLKRLQTHENHDHNQSNFFRDFSREEESFEDEISPGRQLNRALHGTTNGKFLEDSIDENDNEKAKDESPHIFGSPLIQRGYYSDTHVKKVHRTLSKQSLIGINDFELITMISKGAYGRVWLVRRKATNDIYAMKEINLGEKLCKNPKELESLRKENKIFGLAKEDFVVRAVFTFIHETYICFVMEYMLGGDFGDILYNYCALEEEVVRFYIAEIVLALEYLHSLGIVHRDLKPDNILLDKHGHAKLTDFGLSETGLCKKMAAGQYNNDSGSPSMYQKKEQAINKLCRNISELDKNIDLKVKGKVMARRSTISKDKEHSQEVEVEKEQKLKKPQRLIGTPDYMAPEIILGHSLTSYSIDWWSLGVMLFEFLCGTPPFNDETPDKIYDNITKLKIPWDEIQIGYEENCMSPEAADLVKKLLTLDPAKRLGANGADEIKKHPFFKGIDWEKLRTQQAPIIPEQKNEIDTSNFVRLGDELKKKDQENVFNFVPKDKTAGSSRQVAREWLEAASENFSIFNYAALYSDNLRVAEEALKQKEKELKEFAHHEVERSGRKGIYDDIFDMPN